ncbi:MAG TPA: flavodoxin family protein [Clostridia bacterium]
MKILAINGSPNRSGATSKLIDMVLNVLKSKGIQCEKVHLEDYSIQSCICCGSCVAGVGCSIDDDYLHLKAMLLEADGIVIGSPNYNGKPVDNLKDFVDRFSPAISACGILRKKFILGVATSAVDDCSEVAKYCASFGGALYTGGGAVSGILNENTVTIDGIKDLLNDEDVKNRVRTVAEKLIQDIETGVTSPGTKLQGLAVFGVRNSRNKRNRRNR